MIQSTLAAPGLPNPLGATLSDGGVNFALFSSHAERVDVCVFDARGTREIERYTLPEHTDGVWHGHVAGLTAGAHYGYRVYGPYLPGEGHRFNHHKLLLDPYALAFNGTLTPSAFHYGYIPGDPLADLSFDRRDNAEWVPKCVVVDRHNLGAPRPLTQPVPWRDTVIYEANVRGYTMRHASVAPASRGCFLGLTHGDVIAHIKALGVTSVELLPVQAHLDEFFLHKQGLTNYWGYNTIGFFVPDPRFAENDAIAEFKTLVDRFHDAGLEVILDVVYNHSAEGNELGPTLLFRGIDNATYYRLNPENPRYYINDTGCGNTLNVTHPAVLRLIMDSLRYWVTAFGVDGFRFDLATTLGREAHGFSPTSALLQCIRQDPTLAHCKLIAEPWDIGPGGYRLGQFGPGWAEWNDKSRDGIRRFWRGDAKMAPELARRLHGSSDLFEQRDRRPWASINYVTSHDGFTLTDVVSFNERHNDANGEDNRDGHGENFSRNYGHEGPTDKARINAVRDRQRRNLLASVLFSQGTPMLLAGDEFGHTQGGNNNAYCQDNETTWLDWRQFENDIDFLNFTKALIGIRKRYRSLRWPGFLHPSVEPPSDGAPAIAWYGTEGEPLQSADWEKSDLRSFALWLNAAATSQPLDKRLNDDADTSALLIMFNASHRGIEFTLPSFGTTSESEGDSVWSCVISTATQTPAIHQHRIKVQPHSTILLRYAPMDGWQ